MGVLARAITTRNIVRVKIKLDARLQEGCLHGVRYQFVADFNTPEAATARLTVRFGNFGIPAATHSEGSEKITRGAPEPFVERVEKGMPKTLQKRRIYGVILANGERVHHRAKPATTGPINPGPAVRRIQVTFRKKRPQRPAGRKRTMFGCNAAGPTQGPMKFKDIICHRRRSHLNSRGPILAGMIASHQPMIGSLDSQR